MMKNDPCPKVESRRFPGWWLRQYAESRITMKPELWLHPDRPTPPPPRRGKNPLCWILGHKWDYVDESTVISYEPQIRSVCRRCGVDGGLW